MFIQVEDISPIVLYFYFVYQCYTKETIQMIESIDDTVSILRGLRERYEVHHSVRISDNALVAAATLSERYINDRFLPDKAIDLIDEAASRLNMVITSKPEEIDEIDPYYPLQVTFCPIFWRPL